MRSRIEVMSLADGLTGAVYQTDELIEAPNWLPDGTGLIFNGSGHLYRLHFDSCEVSPVDTGFAVRCNNDHGISADGKRLVISDHTETGQSQIYTLPVAGGNPEKVTRNKPSYWHGWSPDGQTLAYCAERSGRYDIYTIPAGGGEEQCLTDGQGHSDGPDYSPCGRWIYFNSSRSGSMQIWRMEKDGTELTQITRDERVNWFPHPSPDGTKIVYLAYENGVEGHPADKNVQLRLMDMTGGHRKVLLDLYGGQGSLNVPSWSPDSSAFAFVRYEPVN